jgi:hypothetical protein
MVIYMSMQNIKLRNKTLSKLEFLVPTDSKKKFQELCTLKGLGMSEMLKRKFEEAIVELEGRK